MVVESGKSVTRLGAYILGLACLVVALQADLGIVVAEGQAADIPVFINEFLASNSGAMYVDPQGEADDWIELYNAGDVPFDVGGMYLTDDEAAPMRWQIPANNPAATTIPAHGHLLIWADGDVSDSGLHADFSLSAGGEEIALFDADGVTLIDSIRFEQQMSDVSYGRVPDGSDTWVLMWFPTAGGPNFQIFQGINFCIPAHNECYGHIIKRGKDAQVFVADIKKFEIADFIHGIEQHA